MSRETPVLDMELRLEDPEHPVIISQEDFGEMESGKEDLEDVLKDKKVRKDTEQTHSQYTISTYTYHHSQITHKVVSLKSTPSFFFRWPVPASE